MKATNSPTVAPSPWSSSMTFDSFDPLRGAERLPDAVRTASLGELSGAATKATKHLPY